MSRSAALAAILHAMPALAIAQERPEGLATAESMAKAALGQSCDMNGMEEVPIATPDSEGFGHSLYRFAYRTRYLSADQPDITAELYQLFCGSGAYNVRHAFVLKTSDEETPKLLSFAKPALTFDYTNDESDEMKEAPALKGFGSTGILVNATFDEKTRTVTSHAAWRGIGDAWDSGNWIFQEDGFVLTRFEVDPTFDGGEPKGPESYVVYDVAE